MPHNIYAAEQSLNTVYFTLIVQAVVTSTILCRSLVVVSCRSRIVGLLVTTALEVVNGMMFSFSFVKSHWVPKDEVEWVGFAADTLQQMPYSPLLLQQQLSTVNIAVRRRPLSMSVMSKYSNVLNRRCIVRSDCVIVNAHKSFIHRRNR